MSKLFSIINPSDPYTLRAADRKTAIVAVLLLGDGWFGLEDAATDESIMPPMPPDAVGAWIRREFDLDGETFMASVDLSAVADALDSVIIGSANDRELFDRCIARFVDPVNAQRFAADWHDLKRTSTNNIGDRARQYAENLRRHVAAEAAAAQHDTTEDAA